MSLSPCCGSQILPGSNVPPICRCCGCDVPEPLPEIKMMVDSEPVALRAEVVKLRAENEALKTIERQRWENVNRTLGTNYPKQMNEGESAKWTTENRSASQWARDGGH